MSFHALNNADSRHNIEYAILTMPNRLAILPWYVIPRTTIFCRRMPCTIPLQAKYMQKHKEPSSNAAMTA